MEHYKIMHVLEKAFIDLLRNHLTISNDKIYTGNRYRPRDITPCVQLLIADEQFIRRRFIHIENEEYVQQRYNAELWINIYCNSEEQRQNLIEEIQLRINQALANHYTTCQNYNNGKCGETMNACEALDSQSHRANKNQCPNLELYTTFFDKNNISKRTFHINSITDLDELEISESLLRTIFKLEMDYFQYYKIGGRNYMDYEISESIS